MSDNNDFQKTETKQRFFGDGGKLISIEVIVIFLTAVVSGGGAFWATRAALDSRITNLEKQMQISRPTTEYVLRTTLYKQISDLRVLEDQIRDIGVSLHSWRRPKLDYTKGLPPGIPPYLNLPNDIEWLDVRKMRDRTNLRGIDTRVLNRIVLNPEFGAIEDKELVASINRLALRVSSYNEEIAAILPTVMPPQPVDPTIVPTIPNGASKTDVELFFDYADKLVPEMKGLIESGMVERIKRIREKIEHVLTDI